ncbi:hypothetical protein Tco_1287036, partial [Tanacetum coccineum]
NPNSFKDGSSQAEVKAVGFLLKPKPRSIWIGLQQLMVPAGSSWFLLVGFVVPARLLTVSSASIIGPQTPLGLEQ